MWVESGMLDSIEDTREMGLEHGHHTTLNVSRKSGSGLFTKIGRKHDSESSLSKKGDL